MSHLYILDINPLSVISFTDISSQLVSCLFILLIASFVVKKLLSFISSHLFIFGFIYFALGEWPKKKSLWLMSENILPKFFSRSFMVSCLIFRPLNPLELIFVYGVVSDMYICVCVCVCVFLIISLKEDFKNQIQPSYPNILTIPK